MIDDNSIFWGNERRGRCREHPEYPRNDCPECRESARAEIREMKILFYRIWREGVRDKAIAAITAMEVAA